MHRLVVVVVALTIGAVAAAVAAAFLALFRGTDHPARVSPSA